MAVTADNCGVDAILMASGYSRRFGAANKLLQPFKGIALASHTLQLACGIMEFANVIFVAADDEVALLASGSRAITVRNGSPERGVRESIRLGVGASAARYYCFFPCDQPLLDEDTVRALLSRAAPGSIAEPVFEGRPSSPSIFSADFREELLSIPDGGSGRFVKERHRDRVVAVQVENGRALVDVDTIDEFDAVVRGAPVVRKKPGP